MKRASLIAAAICVLGTGAVARSSVIINGDFETGNLSPWTPVYTNGDTIFVENTGAYGAGNNVQDGNYVLAFNGQQAPPGGSIYQSFSTNVGQSYQVQYDIGVDGGGTQQMDVTVFGNDGITPLATDTQSTSALGSVDTHSFNFTADGAQATLQFLDDPNNSTDGSDLILDNVSVTATPEPAALSLLGIGMVGLLIRRRNQCR